MMRNFLFAISVVVLLSACAGAQIHSYNNALLNFNAAKGASKANDDSVSYETALTGLENLAREAEEDAAGENEDVNKISLYRIGATAAWMSEHNNDVIRIAKKGAELCSTGTNADLAPRDCAMLDVMPLLAAIDENSRAYEKLNAATLSTALDRREIIHGEASAELFDSTEKGMYAFLIQRKKIRPKVSESYKNHIEEKINEASGIFNKTYILLKLTHSSALVAGEVNPIKTRANCKILALKIKLVSEELGDASRKLSPKDENADCP